MHGVIGRHVRDMAAAGLAAALLTCFAMPAIAQQPTQAQQNAIRQSCRADYQANCASVSPGGAAALACLQQHADQLSAPCQSAVGAVGKAAGGAPAGNPAANNTMHTQAPPPAAPAMSPRQELAVLRGYCGADYRRYCRGVRPGGGRALECLQSHGPSLSSGCRRALSQVPR